MNTKTTFSILCLFFSLLIYVPQATACDESSASLVSYTDNGDGTYTTVLNVCNEFNGLEGAPEDFSMTFEGVLDIDNFMPATVTTTSNDPYHGSADGNTLSYSTTSIFPGNSNNTFCNDYTIITSEPVSRIIVATHLGRTDSDCINRVVCVASATPSLMSTSVQDNSGLLDLSTLQDPNYTTGTWSGTNVSGTNFDPSGLDGTYILTFTSDETCVNPSTTNVQVTTMSLAVQLSYFEAKTSENCDVVLTWASSSTHHSDFELEQSQDGLTFFPVSQIAAKAPTPQLTTYQLTIAAQQLTKGHYFRLKQNDFAGAWTYSEVLKVDDLTCTTKIAIHNIFPNPVQENAYLNIDISTDMQLSVLMYNAVGTVVKERIIVLEKGNHIVTLDTDHLSTGMYFVKILGGSSASSIGRLIKQ